MSTTCTKITVAPGRLGLTLQIMIPWGAKVVGVHPQSPLRGDVGVGDVIYAIDGRFVTSIEDITGGMDTVRAFEVCQALRQATQDAQKPPAQPRKVAKDDSDVDHDEEEDAEMDDSDDDDTLRPTKEQQFIAQLKDDVQNKVQFPFLKAVGAFDKEETSTDTAWLRHQALTELLQYNAKHQVSSSIQLGNHLGNKPHKVICVPLERGNSKKDSATAFMDHERKTGLMGEFVSAWGSYCNGGTEEDGADLLLHYLSRRFPGRYVNALKQSNSVELSPDFVSHDGTNDIKWNSYYSQLVRYKEEHGDCKVNTKKSDLGKWVLGMRCHRSNGAKYLTPKRIELLDSIGFLWNALPEGATVQPKAGDPRRNRATAAKLVWPNLTPREALLLGGFEEEHLNEIRQPLSGAVKVHNWRTNLTFYKDRMDCKLKSYTGKKSKVGKGDKHIDSLVNILKGEDEDRLQTVFGDRASLLPGFLDAAEERERNGISHTDAPRKRAKRKRDEVDTTLAACEEEPGGGGEYQQKLGAEEYC